MSDLMTTPANSIHSICNSTLTSNQENQTEGKLQGRSVINTPEKISAIQEKFKEIASLKKSLKAFTHSVVAGVLIGGTSLFFMEIMAGCTSTDHEFNMVFRIGYMAWMTLLMFPFQYGDYIVAENTYNNLSNKKFIDWAESEQIQLTYSNTQRCYDDFNLINECNKRIASHKLEGSLKVIV